MVADAIPLAEVIGERLRALREENAVRQEDIAAEARRYGLPWTRATVAAVELGRRQLPVGELMLLPLVLWDCGVKGPAGAPVDLSDLIPDDDRPLLLAGRTRMSARVARTLIQGPSPAYWTDHGRLAVDTPQSPTSLATQLKALRLNRSWALQMTETVRKRSDWHAYQPQFWREVAREAAGDAEQKGAARLGVKALALALAARRAWGRSLTAERDRRFAEQWRGMYEPPAPAITTMPRRWVQAIRGHTTRKLLEELEPLVKDVTKKTTKRRGR